MGDALKEKFKGRFGTGAKVRGSDEMSVASSCIKREVDHFARNAHVTEANLGRLERRLQNRALAKPGGYAPSEVSQYSGASGVSRSRSLTNVGQSVFNTDNAPEAFDWCRLDEYASYLHEQDAIRQKLGVQALQRKLKMDLDNQVSEKSYKKKEIENEEKRYHQNSLVELERWRKNEQDRAEELKNKLMKEKADRDEQLAFERKLKSEELQKKKDEEEALVEKIVNEMEAEQIK